MYVRQNGSIFIVRLIRFDDDFYIIITLDWSERRLPAFRTLQVYLRAYASVLRRHKDVWGSKIFYICLQSLVNIRLTCG